MLCNKCSRFHNPSITCAQHAYLNGLVTRVAVDEKMWGPTVTEAQRRADTKARLERGTP